MKIGGSSLDTRFKAAWREEICLASSRVLAPHVFMWIDLSTETVAFKPNYDGSRQEPVVLPSRVPNLLVNGATGIAVGMATNIPPHNLKEVCRALLKLLRDRSGTLQTGASPGGLFPAGLAGGQGD